MQRHLVPQRIPDACPVLSVGHPPGCSQSRKCLWMCCIFECCCVIAACAQRLAPITAGLLHGTAAPQQHIRCISQLPGRDHCNQRPCSQLAALLKGLPFSDMHPLCKPRRIARLSGKGQLSASPFACILHCRPWKGLPVLTLSHSASSCRERCPAPCSTVPSGSDSHSFLQHAQCNALQELHHIPAVQLPCLASSL